MMSVSSLCRGGSRLEEWYISILCSLAKVGYIITYHVASLKRRVLIYYDGLSSARAKVQTTSVHLLYQHEVVA